MLEMLNLHFPLQGNSKKGGLSYNVGFGEQFYACLIRNLKTSYRNPVQSRVRVIQTIVSSSYHCCKLPNKYMAQLKQILMVNTCSFLQFAGILVGLIYLRTPFGKTVDSSEVTTISGALFLVITNLTFTTVVSVLNVSIRVNTNQIPYYIPYQVMA